jgi:hypothetical protein
MLLVSLRVTLELDNKLELTPSDSAGGQFLRAYVERYNSPPIHNLITFGSQHTGISDIPACGPRDFLCQVARRATKSAVYGSWAQDNLVQVRYYFPRRALCLSFCSGPVLSRSRQPCAILYLKSLSHLH